MGHLTSLPVWAIDRLRMATDGVGVTTLVTSHGCPLRCKYCLNPKSTDPATTVKNYTPEELLAAVRRDALYFLATGGGVCFGGGEPLLYADFISDFAEIAPKDWNLYVETCLNVPRENVVKVCGKIARFYVDIKDANPEIYRAYTGGDARPATENLAFLVASVGTERVTVRVPHIPGYNTEEDRQRTVEKLKQIGCTQFDLFEYKIP